MRQLWRGFKEGVWRSQIEATEAQIRNANSPLKPNKTDDELARMVFEEHKGIHTQDKANQSINSFDKSDLTFNMRCSPQGSLKDQSENGENEPDQKAFFIANGRSLGDDDDDGLNEREVTNMPLQMPSKNTQVSQKKKDLEDRLKAFNAKVRATAVVQPPLKPQPSIVTPTAMKSIIKRPKPSPADV